MKMRKISRRLITALLCVVMLVSCIGVSAFAATKDNAKEYKGYLAIGSSISRGYGLPNEDVFNEANNMRIPGAFPYVVAEELGIPAENRYSATYGGFTASAALVMLGEEEDFTDRYDDEEFSSQYKADMNWRYCTEEQHAVLAKYGDPRPEFSGPEDPDYVIEGARPINDIIADVDLISLEFGIADTFFRGACLADFTNVDMNDSEQMAALIETIIEEAWNGYDRMCSDIPRIIEHIQAINKDADIALIGIYNPISNLTLDDESAFPIGTLFSTVTGLINLQFKAWADEYDNVYYVDVSNVDTLATEEDVSILSDNFLSWDGGGKYTHPSPDSYYYMAYQMINALPEKEPEPASTDISVHMGKVRSVTKVYVDGIRCDFTMEDYVLTVDNWSRFATLMTVYVKDEYGRSGVYTYQLAYDWDNGYTAYRIYSTNDISKTTQKAASGFLNVGKTIVNGIKSLFSN